jgi:hypothetical protein
MLCNNQKSSHREERKRSVGVLWTLCWCQSVHSRGGGGGIEIEDRVLHSVS